MAAGEVGRSLERIEASLWAHGQKIDDIKEQTAKTNGYVGRHEERLNGIDREMRDLKRAPAHHAMKRASDRPDAITLNIPMNGKTIAALLVAAFTIIMAGLTAAAKAGLL